MILDMITQLILLYLMILSLASGNYFLIGDGWMRPLERDISRKCWKCEPSPEELSKCDENLLTHGRKCGILESKFVERGSHCLVEILNCFPKFAYHIEASFIVARGRLIDPFDNDTSLRYFPLNNPVVSSKVIITCTLDGRWEATVPSMIDNRIEVHDLQCITSHHQTMNHISQYFTEIYRRR